MPRGSLHALLHYVRRVTARIEADSGQGDALLLRRFTAQDDETAFAAIIRRHGPMVWGVCTRTLTRAEDAEDAFQATFLVLVRKARSLLRPEQLGPWLYGVALRTAVKARTEALRRQARETPMVDLPVHETTPDVLWRDLRPILDEEIHHLPDRYRTPFLLCYLEGLTNEEAAQRLGCPKGTILSRLSRARELLRGRLTRRGIGLSAVTLATTLSDNLGAAAVSPMLIETTVRLAPLFASGATAKTLSFQAAVLAEGVLKTMSLTQLKLAAVVLLILGIAGSGVGLWARGDGQERPAAAAQDAPPNKDAKKTPPSTAEKKAAPAPKRDDKARVLREQLGKRIKFDGMTAKEDEAITLAAVLDVLAKKFAVQFEVNEKAFTQDGVNEVLQTNVGPIRGRENATLAVLLREVLARIPVAENDGEGAAVYLIRNEEIEITTSTAVRAELGIERNRALRLVWEDFDNVNFTTALQTLAAASRTNVILDPRAVDEEKAKTSVTARFANVHVDTAVRVLVNMLDLQVVKMENVFYVTNDKRATLMLNEQKAAEEGLRRQLGLFQCGPLQQSGMQFGALGGGLGCLGGGLGCLGGGLGALGGGVMPSNPGGGALGIPLGQSGGK